MHAGSHSQINNHRLDAIRQLPLEPMEYCRRWVIPQPGKNYRKVCINALAEVTGISPKTIKDWGTNFHRRPKYVTRMLRQADLINQFKQLVVNGIITLPPDFPCE
ncbi:hypothetical protein WA1_24095 [Scytonema hofmannii PCC 7110]|uniref:Uncharacterized protein n=2 Tax=Scytonema hofmannii TaxID=34078 RepID=A0A139X7Q2_9CYAN|nr:hypothetical protein [Scytonema hofmannii]KYC40724.1 hypothetical protein WA1_24095 [Scytonema hofmannii PCC 7110]USN26957.1 hypothetical protein [synthetic construct]